MAVQRRCWFKISSDKRLHCTHFCGITLICLFYSLSTRLSYFLISSLLQYSPLLILCIADTLLSAHLGPKMLGFFVLFFLYWQMTQSLTDCLCSRQYRQHRISQHYLWCTVCMAEHSCSFCPGVWATEDNVRTMSLQISPRTVPKNTFLCFCCCGAVFSSICISTFLDSLISIGIDWFQSPAVHFECE